MNFAEKDNKQLQISILGDSISTYEGFNPIGYGVYYKDAKLKENELMSVNETWWMQVINGLEGELCVNNSYSGSFVYETCEFSISAEQRCYRYYYRTMKLLKERLRKSKWTWLIWQSTNCIILLQIVCIQTKKDTDCLPIFG